MIFVLEFVCSQIVFALYLLWKQIYLIIIKFEC